MISYPVSPESRWAFYRVSTSTLERHNIRWPRADGGEIVGLDPDIVPLLEVEAAQPAYDAATQKLQRTAAVVDVAANTHTHGWEVVSRTADEIAEDTERDQIKAVYTALLNGTGTSAERITRVERVAAHLLKLQYGA